MNLILFLPLLNFSVLWLYRHKTQVRLEKSWYKCWFALYSSVCYSCSKWPQNVFAPSFVFQPTYEMHSIYGGCFGHMHPDRRSADTSQGWKKTHGKIKLLIGIIIYIYRWYSIKGAKRLSIELCDFKQVWIYEAFFNQIHNADLFYLLDWRYLNL